MAFSGVLLDLDNTLYGYEAAHQPAIETTLQHLSQSWNVSSEDVQDAYKKARKKFNTRLAGTAASHHRLLYFQGLCERVEQNPLRWALEAYELYWNTFLDHITLYPEALSFLDMLQTQGKQAAIVTDLTAHIQFRKLAKLGIQNVTLVTSEEAGHEKPHQAPFQLALTKLDLSPQDTCMIGDSLEKDCLGALALGIKPYYFCPNGIPSRIPQGITPVSGFTQLKTLI